MFHNYLNLPLIFVLIYIKCVIFLDTIIYNVTDGFGWCFTGYCNSTCHVEIKSYSCETTPPTTKIPLSTTVFSSSAPTTPTSISPTVTPYTTVTPDCSSLNPPRKVYFVKTSIFLTILL